MLGEATSEPTRETGYAFEYDVTEGPVLSHAKCGQAPGRTPASVETGGGQLLNRQHAPVEGQA
jgi:hypothetical protein